MARILFTWELGQGLGHLVRYQGLIGKLLDNGHRVSYLARDAERVRSVNPQAAIDINKIQPEFLPKRRRIIQPPIASPATLLFNCGFSDAAKLAARTRIWLDQIRRIKPDLIVADHSPSAVFANKFLGYPLIISGNSFTVPPAERPFRLFQFWRFNHSEESLAVETSVTEVLNGAARSLGGEDGLIKHPSELYRADQVWLTTFEELDSYDNRPHGNYVGTFYQPGFGDDFSWPVAPGPKVFVYLRNARGIENLAVWARQVGASLVLVCRDLTAAQRHMFSAAHTNFAFGPVKLDKVAAAADLTITNGSANTLANFLLAGIPQLVLPGTIENLMAGRRAEILGCGLIERSGEGERFMSKANALLANSDFARVAHRLQAKYASQNHQTASEVMYDSMGLS